MLAGCIGGILKATCYVVLIAIVMLELVWIVSDKAGILAKAKELAFRAVLFLCGFALAMACRSGMYRAVGYEYNENMAATWGLFLYDGLNEETTGACSPDGLAIAEAYQDYPHEVRAAVENQYIKDRIKEKGLGGLLYFWLRKQVMTFNDGTFSWHQEGFFHAWEYEDIIDSSWEKPLQNFYWLEGSNYLLFCTLSQGIWFMILLGVVAEAFCILLAAIRRGRRRTDEDTIDTPFLRLRLVGILTFLGVFLFVMLFEGRARYLYNSVPAFGMVAATGLCELAEKAYRIGKKAFKKETK